MVQTRASRGIPATLNLDKIIAAIAILGSLVIGGLVNISSIDGILYINASTEINGSLNVTENITADWFIGNISFTNCADPNHVLFSNGSCGTPYDGAGTFEFSWDPNLCWENETTMNATIDLRMEDMSWNNVTRDRPDFALNEFICYLNNSELNSTISSMLEDYTFSFPGWDPNIAWENETINSTNITLNDVQVAVLSDIVGESNITVTSIIAVRNDAGEILPALTPVKFISYNAGANRFDVKKASSNAIVNHTHCLLPVSLGIGRTGQCVVLGSINNVDTSMWSEDDDLYLNYTDGTLENFRPSFDPCVQKIATVYRSHAVEGSIYVHGAMRCNDIPNIMNVTQRIIMTYNSNITTDTNETGFIGDYDNWFEGILTKEFWVQTIHFGGIVNLIKGSTINGDDLLGSSEINKSIVLLAENNTDTNYWETNGSIIYNTTLDGLGLGTNNVTERLTVNGSIYVENGEVHIGLAPTGFENYGFTINTGSGGIILQRASTLPTAEPFIRLSNLNGEALQIRGVDGGGAKIGLYNDYWLVLGSDDSVTMKGLAGTYAGGYAYVCVNNAGKLFANEANCP